MGRVGRNPMLDYNYIGGYTDRYNDILTKNKIESIIEYQNVKLEESLGSLNLYRAILYLKLVKIDLKTEQFIIELLNTKMRDNLIMACEIIDTLELKE